MATRDLMANLKEKLAAGFPAIYLHTYEESRAIEEICAAVSEKVMAPGAKTVPTTYLWTAAVGMSAAAYKSGKLAFGPADADTSDPGSAIEFMKGTKSQQKQSVFILRNFHHFLDNPAIQSGIADAADAVGRFGGHLILLSAVLRLPPEVEKLFTLIEAPLPDRDRLRKTASRIGAAAPDPAVLEKVVDSALGLTEFEALGAMSLSIVRPKLSGGKPWDPAVVMEEKCLSLKKEGLLQFYPPGPGLSEVGGMENLKKWVKLRVRAFSDEAKKFGLKPPKGVLLVGPPGTGKSLGARAVAGTFGVPLLRCDIGRIFGSLVGESERNSRKVIETAEALAPVVLWLDEIEKGLAGSSPSGSHDSGTSSRVLSTILTWMAEKDSAVFVYATANGVTSLPPEILRKGRFDEMFSVSLPDAVEREEILNILVEKRGRKGIAKSLMLGSVAELAEGFTGAELEGALDAAMFTAFDNGREISTDDIQTAVGTTVPLSKSMERQIREVEDWCKGRTVPAGRKSEVDGKVFETGNRRVVSA